MASLHRELTQLTHRGGITSVKLASCPNLQGLACVRDQVAWRAQDSLTASRDVLECAITGLGEPHTVDLLREAFNFPESTSTLLTRESDFGRRTLDISMDSVRDRLGPALIELAVRLIRAASSPCRESGNRALLLPAPPRLFGRSSLVSEITDVVVHAQPGRVVHLYGMTGAGKSAVACTVANAAIEDFDAILWFDAARQSPDDLLFELALLSDHRYSFYAARSAFQQRAAVAKLIGDRRLLVVLDGVRTPSTIELARETARAGTVLCTSNWSNLVPPSVGDSCHIPGLSVHDGAELLGAMSGKEIRPEHPSYRQIWKRTRGNSLALVLLASRLRRLPSVGELANRFESAGIRLLATRMGKATVSFSAAVEASIEDFDPTMKLALALAGAHLAGHGSLESLAAAGRRSEEWVEEAVVSLAESSVVEQFNGRRWALHPLVAEYLAIRFDAAPRRLRILDSYVPLALRCESALRTEVEELWLQRMDQDATAIQAQLDWALRSGFSLRAARVASHLGWYWTIRRRESEGRRIFKRLTRTRGRHRLKDADLLARAHYGAAFLASNQSDYLSAVDEFRKAVRCFTVTGNDDDQFRSEVGLAYALWGSGTIRRVLRYSLISDQRRASVTGAAGFGS